MKETICLFILKNYPCIQLTCNAYRALVVQYINNKITVPKSIIDLFHLAESSLLLVDEALNTPPLGVERDRYDLMTRVYADSEWNGLSFLECTEKYSFDKNTFYRTRNAARQAIVSMMMFLFDRYLTIHSINQCTADDLIKSNVLYSISYEVIRLSDSRLVSERLNNAKTVSEILAVASQNPIYRYLLTDVISEMKKLSPDGFYYSMIAKLMLESEGRFNGKLASSLLNNQLQGYRRCFVRKMISATQYVFYLVLFGVNEYLINDGVILTSVSALK